MQEISYQLAVIGNPIAHSLSPQIHHAFAQSVGIQAHYEKILASTNPTDDDSFANIVKRFFSLDALKECQNSTGHGMNVTVPFKQDAFALCEQLANSTATLSNRAKAAKAVNTLYLKGNQLCGDNTDGVGLVNAMTELNWQLQQANIAIIGAGGAVRGVILPLIEAGVQRITIANRTVSKAEAMLADLVPFLPTQDSNQTSQVISCTSIPELSGHFDIIINGTSASLSGEALAFNEQLSCQYAYDMVYRKDNELTPFLQHFLQKNIQKMDKTIATQHVADGLGMLIGQAAVSFEIWTGKQPELNIAKMTFL